jgi:hypothetical protein
VTGAVAWVLGTTGGWGTTAGRGWEAFSAINYTIQGTSSHSLITLVRLSTLRNSACLRRHEILETVLLITLIPADKGRYSF